MVYDVISGEECDVMTIGEIARSTGLSVRALRHYDRIGLLKPATVTEAGYRLYAQSPTNQVFVILPKKTIARLERDFTFEFTAPIDEDHDAVRFVTSWATRPEAVEALCAHMMSAE